jgi:hypothetical protein
VTSISDNRAEYGAPQWKGKAVSTGIFKTPVSGRVALRPLNFDGDRQADLSVHGGKDKAVYVYPAEHYAHWRRELPDLALPWGMFGENLTTEGLQEDTLQVGDRFRIGSTEVVVRRAARPHRHASRSGQRRPAHFFEGVTPDACIDASPKEVPPALFAEVSVDPGLGLISFVSGPAYSTANFTGWRKLGGCYSIFAPLALMIGAQRSISPVK